MLTSPFYLKCTLAAVHLVSTFLVLEAFLNSTHTTSKSSNSSFGGYKSERQGATQDGTQGGTEGGTQFGSGNVQRGVLHDMSAIVESLSDVVMESITYFPNMMFQSGKANNTSKSPFNTSTNQTDYSSFHHTTGSHWWIQLVYASRIQYVMQYITGQIGFIYLPLASCMCLLLAASMPTMASFPKYREDVTALVLITMLYMCIAGHMCALYIRGGVLPLSGMFSASQPSLLVFGSICILHVCTHAVYQCTKAYGIMILRVRQATSGSILFMPIAFMAIVGNYWLALAMPAILYNTPQFCMKDVIVMHAAAAFLPECIGILFELALYVLRRTVDS